MRIIQVWVGSSMEDYYKRCIMSLNRFAKTHSIDHYIYCTDTDFIKNNFSSNSSIKVIDANDLYKKVKSLHNTNKTASLVDLMRYILLKESKEYTYYVDSDCYFVRDPFTEKLVTRDKDYYMYETKKRNFVNNGIIGVTPNSDLMSKILNKSLAEIHNKKNPSNWIIGPKFITNIVFENPSKIIIEDYYTMYNSSYSILVDYYKSQDRNLEKKILDKVKDERALGLHFFKDMKTDRMLVSKGINNIINMLELLKLGEE